MRLRLRLVLLASSVVFLCVLVESRSLKIAFIVTVVSLLVAWWFISKSTRRVRYKFQTHQRDLGHVRRHVVFPKGAKEVLYKRQWGKCIYCGMSLPSYHHGHLDHIVPVADGGSDEVSNLQLTCMPCNGYKSSMSHAEFRRTYGLLPPGSGPPTHMIPTERLAKISIERNKAYRAQYAKERRGV